MKTIAKALVGWVVFAAVASANLASAGALSPTSQSWLGAVILSQAAEGNAASDPNQQSADLLRRARQAMAENDLAAAESLIAQAESLGITYNPFYMGDTPKKARRDLDRKRNAAVTKPSQMFSPLAKKSTPPGADPFAGRSFPGEAAGVANAQVPPANASAAGVGRLPAVQNGPMPAMRDAAYPGMMPGENEASVPGGPMNVRQEPAATAGNGKDNPLRAARLALAVGDVRFAAELLQRARSMRVNYRSTDDTPDKVEMLIRNYQGLAGLEKGTEAYTRATARNMLEQADGLARWGEFDEAERLAGRAASMRVTYGPMEQKPQEMLQQIQNAKRQAGRAASNIEQNAAGFATAAAGFAMAEGGNASTAMHRKAVELVRQSREAIAMGQLDQAEVLARQAAKIQLPNGTFAPGEDCPQLVMQDLQQMRQQNPSQVMTASAQQVVPANGAMPNRMADRALYDAASDPTRNMPVANQEPVAGVGVQMAQNNGRQPMPPLPPIPAEPTDPGLAKTTTGMSLYNQGEAALKANDLARAYQLFQQAAARSNELDPVTVRRLQDNLQMLSSGKGRPQTGAPASSLAGEALANQQILTRQVAADMAHRESNARAMRETDPKGALAILLEARNRLESAPLEAQAREQLTRRIDRAINETKQVIEQKRPQIELAEKNNRIRQDIDRQQRTKVEVQEKLARLIDDFNKLMDEQRWEEAGIKAKQATELDPNNPVVVQVLRQYQLVSAIRRNQDIAERKEQGFMDALRNSDIASIPFDDNKPMVYGDAREWDKLTKSRAKRFARDGRRARTEREIEIEKRLRTPVSMQFTNAPLSKVMEYLAKMADVNLVLDPKGLSEEGVTSDTPVTIELRQEIMLKSALNLILEPLHLSYVVKDEVLKITSEQMRDGQVYTVTYNVADLVIPIPNFVPTSMGVDAAYKGALANMGFGNANGPFGSSQSTPMAVVAGNNGKSSGAGALNPALLAQMAAGSHPGGVGGQKSAPVGAGPGGLGGGTQADFDSLIQLITSTVKPQTWDEVGGPGSIAPFETNLSIVVSQTQDVHEEIVDLLGQLRRLQDLQVTIEVRFITLNDNFFERIGVSFDFAINDNIDNTNVAFGAKNPNQGITYANPADFTIGQGVPRNIVNQDSNRTVTVGMSAPNMFSADLDIPFTQNSFGLAVPQFGGFDATAGAQLGFAILSDIEAYFFVNAAQGDRRSNVLQAPKVTLFNGQQAFVSDTTQSPFVISVVPVVGDFAAAQQPVIVVLSEGTFMTVQAVVSADRRFVRLTVVPFFSKIGDVRTFQFTGSTTTSVDASREGLQAAATDPSKLWNKKDDNVSTTNAGTTVQLPSFSYVTVTTTVSVPDGGTVLLGGIKRLSEGRNEAGVPMLDKLPYINRLFKNVAIGRETQSLMMMVTPRIIIQEEEEERLGIQSSP